MATTTQLAHVVPQRSAAPVPHSSVTSDGGPWLFLAAPVSFALILLALIYLARISF